MKSKTSKPATFILALILAGLALMLALPAREIAAARGQPAISASDRAARDLSAPTASDPAAPQLSSLTSTTPQCYKTSLRTDTCYVNWYQLSVQTTSPATISSMTVTINGKIRANYQGFFQISFSISPQMTGAGFQVPCGYAGVSGTTDLGYSYNFAVSASDSTGASVSNSGIVRCPANNLLRTYLPLLRKS